MKQQSYDSVDKNIVDVSKPRTASSKAVREFRTRLNSTGQTGIAYDLELLRNFARNQSNALLHTCGLVALVAVISSLWIDSLTILAWALVALVAHFTNDRIARSFLNEPAEAQNASMARKKFVVGQLVIGAAWAGFAYISCLTCTNNEFLIVQFSTILVFVTATTMLSQALGLYSLAAVLPPTVMMAGKLAISLQTPSLVMAGILVAALIFSQLLARRFLSMVVTMLEHSTENEVLIAELETEKSISESARTRAEEASLAKSRFLATMSHELRTPLNAILGFSEVMRDEVFGPIKNDNYREYVNDIHNSGSHLLKLINEILDISRIEAGKHDLEERSLQLVGIVEEARRMMSSKAKQKDIKLTTAYEQGLPDVWVDQQAIRQVTLNLLSNAMKFTPSGGEVCVKVGWTSKGGQYFSVKDNGPGIPKEEITLVLSSFGQGSIAIKHAEPGTGLGLSIVQALLDLHQGRFDLKSKLREGTEATAFLPAARVINEIHNAPPLDSELSEHEPEESYTKKAGSVLWGDPEK